MRDRTGQCWLRDVRYPYVALVLSPPEFYNDDDDIVHECLLVRFDGKILFGGMHEDKFWEHDPSMTRIA